MGGRYTVALAALALLLACGRVTDPPRDGAIPDSAGEGSVIVTDSGGAANDVGGGADQVVSEAGSADSGSCGVECFRAVICCRSDCTGPAVNRGCCACEPGEIDSLSCSPDRSCVQAP
jgi:hypothetical protein